MTTLIALCWPDNSWTSGLYYHINVHRPVGPPALVPRVYGFDVSHVYGMYVV